MVLNSSQEPPSSEPSIPSEIHAILATVHNDVVGHNGVQQTLDRLITSNQDDATDHRTWRKYIKLFRQQCSTCQSGTQTKFAAVAAPFTVASTWPMDQLAIDTIGPLPEDSHGNKYIIVFIDAFTRFVELYAVPDTTAEICASKLLEHVGRYGVPVTIQSDQGTPRHT